MPGRLEHPVTIPQVSAETEQPTVNGSDPVGNGKLQAPRDLPVGGQAVLEGVMMRGVSTWAVAVRKPTAEQLEDGALDPEVGAKGEIEVVTEPLVSYAKEHRWARLPVLRGIVHSWLVQKSEVIAFCVAGRADGGHGALIVLLRPALDY